MTEPKRFVRITYQECREVLVGPNGSYEPMGIEQDIRLIDGYFDIHGDTGDGIELDVVDGRLMEPGERRKQTLLAYMAAGRIQPRRE